jgi:hypothetical protein
MSIANVALSNTFNELRTTTNTVITEVNKLSDGTAVLVVDSITANTFTGVSSDLNISANTGTDVVSLVTESLRIVGTNGISTSIVSSSNTINVNLDTSGITAGAYGSASKVPQLIIDAQGRVTSASNVNVAGVSAFNYHNANANFQIATADGGSFTASIGQDLGTTANVTFQHLTVSGNLTVTGTTTTISANNLVVEDNLIYLNDASSNTNVDLGFAGNYNDGVYRHAGLFRDADDGVWKFFDRYTLEPDASANLDTSHVSFRFAALKAGDVTSNGTFYGPLTGVAAVATVANTSTLTADNTTNATNYLTFVNAATGNQALRTDIGLSFNPSTNTLTTTTFSGAFSGSGAALTSIPNSATTASASNGASTIVARDAAGAFAAGAVTINEFSSAQSISKVLNVQSGSYGVWVNPRFSPGSYNPLTSANSAGLIFTNSASQSGNGIFLLAPWSDIAAGIRISQSSHTANTTIASNTLLLAADTTIDGPARLKYFDEPVTALTLSGGNTAVDWNLGAVWNITLTANSTIYFTNPPSSNRARTVTLFITNSGASQKSLTVTGARYTDGVAPVLSSAASAVDAISFTTIDGGLNYYGSFILAALA